MAATRKQQTSAARERDSYVDKAPTGIRGLDYVTRGGLPRRRTTLVVGGPGAGKTLFALQALVNGAVHLHEPGIFVAFEENSNQIVENAKTFGWDLDVLQRKNLFFLDARLSPAVVRSGSFDLEGMLAGLAARAKEMKAKRIVFDGLDVLLSIMADPVAERREAFRIHEWLMANELTGIITAKSSANDMVANRYDFMQFMVDAVIILDYRLVDRVSLRSVRVLKYRGSGFSEGEYPVVITPTGIDVSTFGDVDMNYEASNERVSSGIERLDAMLNGGYHRGSAVLISGVPGTAKTTLAAAAIEASCRRGEHALFVTFDEASGQLMRNVKSVGIDLRPHVKSGLLHVHAVRTETKSAEEHLIDLKGLITTNQPKLLALDPISALEKTGGHVAAKHAALRVIDYAKACGITTVCTSLIPNAVGAVEHTAMEVSTIADTWIHLQYVAMAGERNRTITIIKSRGTRHSNQVRELVLSDEGVSLADVYTAGGEVLVGTARWEMEQEQLRTAQLQRLEAERRRQELELAEAELKARMAALEREVELKRTELEVFEQTQVHAHARSMKKLEELGVRRGADKGYSSAPRAPKAPVKSGARKKGR